MTVCVILVFHVFNDPLNLDGQHTSAKKTETDIFVCLSIISFCSFIYLFSVS